MKYRKKKSKDLHFLDERKEWRRNVMRRHGVVQNQDHDRRIPPIRGQKIRDIQIGLSPPQGLLGAPHNSVESTEKLAYPGQRTQDSRSIRIPAGEWNHVVVLKAAYEIQNEGADQAGPDL